MSAVLDCRIDSVHDLVLDEAARQLSEGALAVIPTDTVYGIAADAFSAQAVTRLLQAKGRGRAMPPPVLIPRPATLEGLAVDVGSPARALAEAFWPGALTLVCQAQPMLDWDLGDTHGTVALRVPNHPVALELLDRTGPLAVSSANTTGSPAALTAAAAQEMLGDSVAVYLDDREAPGGEASTIVDTTVTPMRILRAGAISLDELRAVVGADAILAADEEAPGSEPG